MSAAVLVCCQSRTGGCPGQTHFTTGDGYMIVAAGTQRNLLSSISGILVGCVVWIGCAPAPEHPGKSESSLLKPAQTTDIEEFQTDDEDRVVDPTRPVTDPISGPLAVLKNAQLQLPQLAIQQALELFNASEGRYPRDHQEFMQRIIAENRISLPQLPAGHAWKYDVARHQVLAVQDSATEPAAGP